MWSSADIANLLTSEHLRQYLSLAQCDVLQKTHIFYHETGTVIPHYPGLDS